MKEKTQYRAVLISRMTTTSQVDLLVKNWKVARVYKNGKDRTMESQVLITLFWQC